MPNYQKRVIIAGKNVLKSKKLMMIEVAIIGIVAAFFVFSYVPLFVLNAGVHEFGHAIAVDLTGGKINSINISAVNESGALKIIESGTNRTGGAFLVIATAGATFALLIAYILAQVPVIRWFAPIMGGFNLLQMLWFNDTTDGYQVYQNYGAIIASALLLVNFVLYLLVVKMFVKGNYITKAITKKINIEEPITTQK